MFADYLAKLANLRQHEQKAGRKGQPREQLLKLMANSFYGKLGQGLSGKTSRSTSTGQMVSINEAKVTCPPYAAMCTGIVRAALASVVYELSRHDGFEVLSATTDGCMVQVPDTADFTNIDEKGFIQGLQFPPLFPSVYKHLCDYPAIQLLMQGRRNTGTDPDEWMEVKHAGSRAYTYKTRIYSLEHAGVTQHIATAGMRLDKREVSVLHAYHEAEGIPTHTVKHLPSVYEMLEGKYADMITVPQERRVNTDFDYKRIPLPGTPGLTRPPVIYV
jgi:DNA polymerase elongation subunit (family B)